MLGDQGGPTRPVSALSSVRSRVQTPFPSASGFLITSPPGPTAGGCSPGLGTCETGVGRESGVQAYVCPRSFPGCQHWGEDVFP